MNYFILAYILNDKGINIFIFFWLSFRRKEKSHNLLKNTTKNDDLKIPKSGFIFLIKSVFFSLPFFNFFSLAIASSTQTNFHNKPKF